MALIDIVKSDGNADQVAWKFPSSNLRLGTQLVVKPGQVAIFVYKGKIADEVSEGTVTLKTSNIPFLTKLASLPFGGDTPFQAEVWFINTLSKLDTKWGTQSPIQVQDPKYGVILPVRAYGQYGFRVTNPRVFLTALLGVQASLSNDRIKEYFRGKVVSTIGTLIGGLIVDEVSFFNLSAHLATLSEKASSAIRPTIEKYGIDLEDFFFESINVPEDDPSYVRLRGILEKAGEINVVGRDIYQLDRVMDVLKTGAGNEGLVGLMAQGSLGSGMGLMLGAQLGQQVGSAMQIAGPPQLPGTPQAPPPLPVAIPPIPVVPKVEFFVALNGKQSGPFDVSALQNMKDLDLINGDTLVWKEGMPAWSKALQIGELAGLFSKPLGKAAPPPIPQNT